MKKVILILVVIAMVSLIGCSVVEEHQQKPTIQVSKTAEEYPYAVQHALLKYGYRSEVRVG